MWNMSEVATPTEWHGTSTTGTSVHMPQSFAGALYITVLTLGFIGNPLIIVVHSRKTFRTPGNLFTLNLAIADTGVMCSGIIHVHSLMAHNGEQFYGDAGCFWHAFFVAVCSSASVVSMAFVAITRYISIIHPQRKHCLLRWQWCILASVLVWVYSIVLCVPIMAIGGLAWLPKQHHCSLDFNYSTISNLIIFMGTYCLTSTTILFCYVSIYRVFRASKKRIHSNQNPCPSAVRKISLGKNGQVSGMVTEYRLAVQLIVVFLVYNICWLPFIIIAFFVDTAGELSVDLYAALKTFTKLNSAINAVVYVIFNKSFRAECRKLLCMFKKNNFSSSQSMATS